MYQRTGEPCRVCGATVERVVVGGRGTHYCPGCQPRRGGMSSGSRRRLGADASRRAPPSRPTGKPRAGDGDRVGPAPLHRPHPRAASLDAAGRIARAGHAGTRLVRLRGQRRAGAGGARRAPSRPREAAALARRLPLHRVPRRARLARRRGDGGVRARRRPGGAARRGAPATPLRRRRLPLSRSPRALRAPAPAPRPRGRGARRRRARDRGGASLPAAPAPRTVT